MIPVRWALACAAASALLAMNVATSTADDESVSVTIVDAPRPQPKWGYAPRTQTVAPGTWVTWSNDGQDAHTVTAVDGSFDSGDLDPSEGFSWYFDQPGTYLYICALHDWMTGKIIVRSSQPSAISDQPTPTDTIPQDPGEATDG